MPGSPQARNTYMPNEKCLRHSQLHGPGLLERENRETERDREREGTPGASWTRQRLQSTGKVVGSSIGQKSFRKGLWG